MHPHHWVRNPGSYLLNDSGMVAGDGIEPPLPAYETGLEPLQLSRKKFVRIFSCQRPQTLAQGEGLEPPPTGLEPVMLPVTPTLRTKPSHCKNWTRAEVSNLASPGSEPGVLPLHQLGLDGPRGGQLPSDLLWPRGGSCQPMQEPPLVVHRTYGALFLLKAR